MMMKNILLAMVLACGTLAGTVYAAAPAAAKSGDAARSKAAAKWVKKEMADVKKAIGMYRKITDSASCRKVSADLKKLLAPYETAYGVPVERRGPAGMPGADAQAGKLPDGLTMEDIQAEQRKQAAQRKKLAAEMKEAHKCVDSAVRASFNSCHGGPTTDIDTSYADSAAFYIQDTLCRVPE